MKFLYVKKENKNWATDLRIEYFKEAYKVFTNEEEMTIKKT